MFPRKFTALPRVMTVLIPATARSLKSPEFPEISKKPEFQQDLKKVPKNDYYFLQNSCHLVFYEGAPDLFKNWIVSRYIVDFT